MDSKKVYSRTNLFFKSILPYVSWNPFIYIHIWLLYIIHYIIYYILDIWLLHVYNFRYLETMQMTTENMFQICSHTHTHTNPFSDKFVKLSLSNDPPAGRQGAKSTCSTHCNLGEQYYCNSDTNSCTTLNTSVTWEH